MGKMSPETGTGPFLIVPCMYVSIDHANKGGVPIPTYSTVRDQVPAFEELARVASNLG